MSLEESFNEAMNDVKKLRRNPDNDDERELYALYMQATTGNVNTPRRPHEGAVEWDAWHHKRDTHTDKAKQDYINKVRDLVNKIGFK